MRKFWHRLIVRYLRRAGGAAHANPGANGRYIVLMTEPEYHAYRHREPEPAVEAETDSPDRLAALAALRGLAREEAQRTRRSR